MGQSCLSKLTAAINEGDLKKVKLTLPTLNDINSINIDEDSLIAYSAARGNLKIIEHLINEEIDVNRVGANGKHALTNAVKNNLIDVVKLLVKHNSDVNYLDTSGYTPLIIAVKRNYEDIAKFLLNNGASISIPGNDRIMPLSYAVHKKNEKMMKLLLDKGAIVTVHTALLTAISGRDFKIVQFLQEYNSANVNLNELMDDYTLLTKAAQVQNIDIVKFLVEKGANVNQKDAQGRTPLSVAISKQDICVFNYLIQNGANWDHALGEIEKIKSLNTDFRIYLSKLNDKIKEMLLNKVGSLKVYLKKLNNKITGKLSEGGDGAQE